MTVTTLYFGTDRVGGVVTDSQWHAFVDEVVTPRFPDGLTHWRASGQWKSASLGIVREASHVLVIAHSNAGAAVDEIVGDYKSRFDQEAVLEIESPGCVSF